MLPCGNGLAVPRSRHDAEGLTLDENHWKLERGGSFAFGGADQGWYHLLRVGPRYVIAHYTIGDPETEEIDAREDPEAIERFRQYCAEYGLAP